MSVSAGDPDGTGGLEAVLPLRRNRDFQLLWGGQAVSLLGSQTSKIAYPLLVLALTGSPAKAGIIVACMGAGGLAGALLAGFLLQAPSPSAAMTAVTAGMAVTAATATALAPVRRAGRPRFSPGR